MDFKTLEPQVRTAFNESLLQYLNVGELRRMLTVPVPNQKECFPQLLPYGLSSGVVTLNEYADYINVSETDAVEKAKILGAGCAILYNAIIKNARITKKHAVVTDLLDNDNLKFMFVINSEPSVADPLCLMPGWISFRFRFSSTALTNSLDKGKTLLAAEKTRAY
jgi:hypothetical protein